METVEELKKEIERLNQVIDSKTNKRYRIQCYFFDGGGKKWFITDVYHVAYSEIEARNYLHNKASRNMSHAYRFAVDGFHFSVEQVEFEKHERDWKDDMADRWAV